MPRKPPSPSEPEQPHAPALHRELRMLAARHGLGVNDIVSLAREQSGQHVPTGGNPDEESADERRFFPRSPCTRTAVAQICEKHRANHYISCTITDLSFSGVQVMFPAEAAGVFMAGDFDGFELLFSLPEQDVSVFLRCRVARLYATPEHLIVGAQCEQSQLARRVPEPHALDICRSNGPSSASR
ncbi:hypothetical protein DPQ33_10625 [Oceanidesulfovibrio indonesiensis]|uniref:PilZ domain-containing protein n=1 Tax=Oceanidesulfovibrio indonesiensis TaxID=54767 RepID=A0A7M3MDR4_9BACT|nr:PilZ domain-containing protein [Oceanidesulfovibrio indonesiensis]TVM16861.1 hypothetical protein DPQ33_10625 [Oceanidesulfovibrio indonesiensis]